MAREIPLSKRLEVVKLYFEGLSYDEIVKRTGVAKGTVATIVEELKEGRFPQVEHLSDLVNSLSGIFILAYPLLVDIRYEVYDFSLENPVISMTVLQGRGK